MPSLHLGGNLTVASIIMIVLGVALMLWAIYTYFVNTQPGPMDVMGRSITFSTFWGGGSFCCGIGIGLLPSVAWWWGLVAVAVLYPAAVLLQPVLDVVLRVLGKQGAT